MLFLVISLPFFVQVDGEKKKKTLKERRNYCNTKDKSLFIKIK
jgi:hypothetical protein